MFFTGIIKSILRESRTDSNSLHPLITASSSSSSSSTRQYSFDVFPSFSGQDVRKSFLSHFREGLKSNGISTFVDNRIMKSESINSQLVRAIRESRVAVVILSKNYASSSWCLNELLLIMECRVTLGQTVMTVFYNVDPSDVRNQTGDFGKAFEKTCDGKTKEEKQRWREALTQVAVIAGEHSVSWASEAEMISKIVMDVSNELPSSDFHRLVGIETHVENMKSMICLESDEVKIVGIWGPVGIGKTTIARALYKEVSCNFQLKFYKDMMFNLDQIGLQNQLENELYTGVLDHKGMKIPDLQEAKFRLKHQRVLLILDNVCSKGIHALGNLIQSLRFGSKVIVISEDIDTLRECRINQSQTYKVAFPSSEEALQIFSYSAFGQSSPPRGYLEQANEVAKLVAPFPLGLRVVGSSLRGKSKDEWIKTLAKLKTYPDGMDVEKAIKFAYDALSDKHKTLLLLLTDATILGENVNNVIFSLSQSDWDVEKGIQTLADIGLISISEEGGILMSYMVECCSTMHYEGNVPSSEEAQQIFPYFAFGQSSPPRGYMEHAIEVAKLVAPFPLGLKKTVTESEDGLVSLALICSFCKMSGYLKLGDSKGDDIPEDTIKAVADTLRTSSAHVMVASRGFTRLSLRLKMTIAFTSIMAIYVIERIDEYKSTSLSLCFLLVLLAI
ncbi:NB-ARC [Arabidopsis suecica]|uniref:NB-ARC n=1 Tax=Arabidopsis suecica TaxID=45249 RepID=A0A8T1Z9S3_ARASU|nr:NB-ARC [Arabidopsis suecica]